MCTYLVFQKDSMASNTIYARLDEPIIFLESFTYAIPLKTIQSLKWKDRNGRNMPSPSIGTKIEVIYHQISKS